MQFARLYEVNKNYKTISPQIIFFEILYLMKGYGLSAINISNNNKYSDNIPCPYFFLYKIKNFLIKNDIGSLIDLGCGSGRVIKFFNKYLKIKYYGLELISPIYSSCKKTFQKYDNIEIFNEEIMNLKFINIDNDCFFIKDPLKKEEDFKQLIRSIIESKKKYEKKIYFILINITEDKRSIFNDYELIESLQTNLKGYYIYSNHKKNEISKN